MGIFNLIFVGRNISEVKSKMTLWTQIKFLTKNFIVSSSWRDKFYSLSKYPPKTLWNDPSHLYLHYLISTLSSISNNKMHEQN